MWSARRVVAYRVAQSLMRLGSLMRLAALIASQAALALPGNSAVEPARGFRAIVLPRENRDRYTLSCDCDLYLPI